LLRGREGGREREILLILYAILLASFYVDSIYNGQKQKDVPQTIVVQHVDGYVLGIVLQTGFLRILLLGGHCPLGGRSVSFLPHVKRFLLDTVRLMPRVRG
jgi:hypothetical protein